ncbi:unnamed protein product [Cochlearia groenlandica]
MSPTESQANTQPPPHVYDTLTPLSLSESNQSPPLNQSPATTTLGDSNIYTVFRNDISDSTVETTSVVSDPVDFFSLNVDAVTNDNINEFVTPKPITYIKKKSKKRKKFEEEEEAEIPMLQLHKEIVDFCEFLSPTQEEKAKRDEAMESVNVAIQYIWPNCKVKVFGSYKMGLCLPTSDIDMVIMESGIENPRQGLRELSRALSQMGIAENVLVISSARVPIIKFVEKKSSISFDICFDRENGPKAAEFIQDAVLRLPPLRPLCMILKVFLQQRELNVVSSGGLGSYALITMLIAFLNYLEDGRSAPEYNLGVLLVKFFDFYGRKLNTANVSVSCQMGDPLFSKRKKGFRKKARLGIISIEDPQAPENDLGKSTSNYFQIRSAFAMALSTLTNTKAILALGPNRSILGTIIRPDRTLLERKGGKNGEVTFNSLLPGAGEPLPMPSNHKLFDEDKEGFFPRGFGAHVDIAHVGDTSGKKTKESCLKKKKRKIEKKDLDELEEKFSWWTKKLEFITEPERIV